MMNIKGLFKEADLNYLQNFVKLEDDANFTENRTYRKLMNYFEETEGYYSYSLKMHYTIIRNFIDKGILTEQYELVDCKAIKAIL